MASFDTITIPARGTKCIIELFEKHEHMIHEEAKSCVAKLPHYYVAFKHGKNGSPLAKINKVCHAHILNTPMYIGIYHRDEKEEDIYGYLVDNLGAEHINAAIWDRDGCACGNDEFNGCVKITGRCQDACKACNSCNSIG